MLAVQLRTAECADPDTVMMAGEFAALLVTVTLPDTSAAVVGVKTTLRFAVWPAPMVTGGVRPLVVKSAPETLIWEMLTLELPVLVSVTVCVLLLPKATFPKLKEVGLAESCRIGATPVPLRTIVVGDVGALLTRERVPVALPATVGVKLTVNAVD